MSSGNANFGVGEIVEHRLFGYRGVVFDVDPSFQGSDEWYDAVARSRPPKDAPWYHVLVHGATHTTYVAERNLGPDSSGCAIEHPLLAHLFEELRGGRYVHRSSPN